MVGLEQEQLDCEACKEVSDPASDIEINDFLAMHPEWQCEQFNDVRLIVRDYSFKNFKEALAFTNLVGTFAEVNGHHPSILTEWGRVSVTYFTHKINDVHRIDLMMAGHTDRIFNQFKAR